MNQFLQQAVSLLAGLVLLVSSTVSSLPDKFHDFSSKFTYKPSVTSETQKKTAQTQKSDPSVLAATIDRSKTGVTFTIPAFFKDLLTLDSSLEVNGPSTFNNTVTLTNQDLNLGTGELTASNVLYGLTAGKGIIISQGQTPEVKLDIDVVSSISGRTGDVDLEEGSGISVDGLEITNTDKGSSQNIFKTFSVSGQDDIVASSNTSKLTFAAGTGIVLTTDASGKILTITSGLSTGWVDDGTSVRLTTSSDSVGIGTSTPAYKLDVVGDTNIASGYAFKINGTNVLTGTALGTGVTASSLTSLGTLGNVTVTGASALNGGITFDNSTDTISAFTAGGTINLANNLITNVGNAGTDFTASGGLTLAGLLTASSGVSLDSETVTDFSGNGIVVTSNSLFVNLTTSSNTGATSSNSGLEVGTAGLTLLKGCSDGELLKYTDAGGWACSADIDTTSGSISGFTDFGSIVALITSADNLGVGTSSPTNKLSVVGNADISGNLGVGTTTPGYKLDVAGNANLASGFTYKINGNDVLSGTTLGVGVTSSSLTQLGTLGNLTVTGAIVGNGGLTLAAGQTLNVNSDAITDLTGNGIVLSGGALTVGLTSSGTTGSSSSNSGLEVGSAGLTLLKGCADNELLKYTDASGWACAIDIDTTGANLAGFTDFGSIVALTTTADNLGVGTSSPTNKLSVVGTADISGNLGIGTTTPAYKLDVAGNVNLSTGSTLKINGTDVLSASGLGVGVTASSLTSLGTLGNLTVTGTSALNGGITFDSSTDTISAFTAGGTINMATNIITDIGNSGTDFTGAGGLNLAGLLTALSGVSINSETVTDFSGSGITVSSNALAVNLTSSGTTGSTSSNSGLEVGSGGLTLLKGCTDGELLKYTDAGGWACSTDSNTGNISGFTDFGSIVALTTTADNLGVGTSSPTNKLSVVGTADISGNLGVGTTTPAFKLDVAGSTNLSSGSTYKINGTDVLSGSALGVGVTASSLTSVGTLGNLTVTGAIVGNGGLTLATGQTFTMNGDAFTDLTGSGIIISGNALTIGLTTSGTTGSTSSNSGLEVGSAGLTLLKGCTDGELLKYTDAGGWACASDIDTDTNSAGFTDFGSIVALTTTADSVGIGTSSPANKLSVVGNADVSGNFGIGTTNPGYKLDVAGSVNISTGSTYKINGTDVLSGNTLGSGITASSLTSVGTLTNLGVGNSGSFGGGLLVGGETLTDFTGNGVTLSSGALTVNLTSSGTTGSTSSNSGLEVGSAGLTLLKGCTDGELLKYTDAGGWACATDSNSGNVSGFTDFGSIVALTTTADNLGVGTSSPTNKLSVVGNTDISGNLGVGVTTPAFKLDVAGSANLSSGSTYKINGTDVLSASGLGVGVTASSLTSLGTLGNLTVTGAIVGNGGLTLATGQTFTINGDAFTDLTGNGIVVSGNALTISLTSSGNTGSTSSNSGLEVGSAGLTLLKGCTDGELLKYTDAGGWACSADSNTGNVSGFTDFGSIVALTTTADNLGVGTSSPTNKLSVVGNVDISGNLGVGTTTPGYKLDVAGNVNISTGSTYKINGTDVLSVNTLGSGVTTSSLTSVGTLTNLGVGNSGSFGGGLLVGGQTLTNFTGNGVTLSSGALTVALTSSGTTGSTSSNSGLEVGSGGLTLLKGCSDGEILKYTDASGWACATDTDTDTNTSGFTDFGSIVALTTSADNLGVGTSSPTNKLSVVGNADISGNLGVGTTTPAFKLDVAGSANLSSGSTYKINGTDVLSGSALGVGVTASSLTSVGTLGNLTVTGAIVGNGGLTLAAGQTLNFNSDAITDLTGNGIVVSGNTLTIGLTSSGTTGSTSSNSGLEVGSGGLTLLKGCTDGELLKYTDAGGWACSTDIDTNTGNISGFTDFGSIVALTTTADSVGIGTSSPANKLSVVGNADVSGNFGIGTTNPGYKLDVAGSANLSSGSTYKINGTDVLSGTTLGSGVTGSSLTSVGTLTNLGVGNSGAFGGGLLVGGRTLTSFTGNGVTLSSGELTVALTSSGTIGSTSSNSGLEVGSAGLTLLKGCADGELLKYTDASGWACATDTDTDTDTNNSGFTDFGSIVALTTTADNLGVGTSSPTNKLSVVGNADISGNLGVGTTTPAFKLDVAGSTNLSSGSTYKINGTDVISASGLGVGVTASSLTSLGTLGNLTVAGTSALNGGITFDSSTDTISAFTLAGAIDAATNLITNIGNAGTDFIAGGGLNLAGVFTANNTTALNGATTLGDNAADTVTSIAGVWSFTNATTVDLADSSRGALNFEGGLLALDTLNSRIGIGTTTPTTTLDVVGTGKFSGLLTASSGVSINSETVTDFSGNGIAVTANALGVNLTSSGTTGSTSSNSGLEVGSAGLTLLKGCTDGELLKYTDAGGWACAADTDTNTGNISGFTDFGSIVALTTTADNLGVGTSSPTNKLSVVGNADISGNLGIGTTTPAFKLDVAGSANLSSGSTYKINGTDVLSGTTLGSGVTASSLTSVGTLTNLGVGNSGAFGGGLLVGGRTLTSFTGNGVTLSSGALTVNLTSSGTTGSTSSNSGLEVGSAGLTLLKGCTDGELLKYTDASGWACAADIDTDSDTNNSGFTDFGSIVALTTTADNLGVGTSSPTNKLSVVGNADISGNLGVGTTTPGAKLDVVGTGRFSGLLTATSGVSINGETVTDLSGSGIVVTGNALGVNLTTSGDTGSTSSNSGLEVGAGGLTLLKGCNDGEILKYTDAGGWACTPDVDNDTNNSGFTDFGSIVALTTNSDNVGIGTSSPANKLSVVGNADVSGNFGIGTTAPAYNLEVIGTGRVSGLLTASSGVSINGETVTDLSGSGIVLSGNALTVNLTSSGNTGSTSSNSGLEVGAGGLTLIKGCADGEILKYSDAGGWACAADVDNDSNTSGFTDYGSIVALTTTADNLGVGTSSPSNKLSVLGNADISGNLGVGTTTPAFKLDVAGSTNLSSGSTYKINGTDVISASGLGVGVTASSLTSLGTLGNLTVAGTSALNGGITFDSATDTISAFTLAGAIDAATNLITNIGNAGTDFIAGGGLTLAGAFTSNSTSALNGAVTLGDNAADTITANAGVWSFTNATTVDLADSSRGALNFEGGLLALDTLNSRIGIGTTTPTQKLDVAGNINVSSGSTYKIAGTDVLSGNTLGAGITASSLTSVGTLTNLGVGNSGSFGGGLLVGGETLTDFTGNGVTLSSGALTVALTSSGNTGSTSSNSGLEVGSAGLTLLKGCADGELLKYTDAGGWACATDTDSNTGNISGFTDFGSIVAMTTSADNLGVGTSSPTNKLSVVGNADISGNLGVGTTTPAFKLDVAGSTNLSSGSTYKINGTDVLSASGLGVGVTASSLTSLGTLGNLTVAGTSALNGGITFDSSTDTISAFTLAGAIDAATNLITNIGDAGTDFVAGGGLTLAGAFTSNSTSALNGAVTLGDNAADTVTANAGVWSFTNATTVNLADNTRGALNFEGGLLALDTLNGRIGIGTTTPTQKLDVAGNVNISSGSTYKIAGTDVLSGNTLGAGITASSLTSVGTLTNLGVGNSGAFGGGLLVGGETLTDFTGNGVTLSSGALTVALTGSGTTGSTSSNSGLEVGSAGLTLLKGCTDGELLKYTDAGGWACATDTDTNTGNVSGFTDFGNIVALTTTADNLGVGTSSPTNKLSVLGNADISGNLGVGTTTPGYKLDVVGSANLSTGSTYKINGTDVLSASGLGVGVTASSLTSLGTLGNVTVTGTSALNGGITFDNSTDTISAFTAGGTIDMATNLITNIGNAGTDFIAGGGLTLAGAFTANSTAALNAAVTLGDAAADTVTSNAGVWSFTNATTVDLADNARQALNFESGLFNLDTLNGRIGIGTTTPTQKLDVAGNVNVSSGSTYKINGTDVLSGNTLGAGITASSLTSVGTLTNLGVGNSGSFGGGILVGGETLTDFTGNGVTLSSGALTVNLTSSGNTGSTSSNSGLEVGSAGLTLLKGCTDGELLKYTDAGGWACATDTDTNTGNISGFTDFGSIVALTTTADNLGVGTSSPTNKLSVVGNADISGNLGVGTTTPAFKLDVAGSTNLSSGSTYKINGTDVLSGSGLGVGVTASSLTSLGTLGNVTVTGVSALNGGITFDSSTDTISAFTLSGTQDAGTNLIVNIGDAGTDFIAGGGLTLAGAFTANSTSALNGAVTLGDNAADTVTSNAGVWSFANATTLNLADNARGALNIESGLMNFDTLNGRIGIGTTTPTQKLDVAGNVNISTGSTYKINGTDVLSGNTLGSGITASSLTSVGTLTNLGVGNSGAFGGGLLVGGETLTDFTGNGVTLSSGALTVALTSSGNTGSTSSNSGLEVGSGGLTLLKGCADNELLKYTDASGWACATDTDTNTGNISGFTDFGSIVALTTTADNLGVGTSSPTNKLSVLGTADISGNLGIGTTTPAFKLDVSGNVNISTGSTYKINGTDVLSVNTLGSGVTTSSLTSVGTLTNLGVGNSGSFGGGLLVGGETLTDFTGNGVTLSSGALTVALTASGNTGSTSSNSGLEVGSAGLTLLKGCTDGELLKYTDAGGWACAADIDTTGANVSGFTDFGSIVALTTTADNLGVGTSSPTNKLSVVGTADISGNLGVGTTTPAYKLDVVGSANLSTGSTYKINGTDVLSASGLGVGVTASSLTSLGTLGNVTVTGTSALNGGITFDSATDTISAFTAGGTIDLATNLITNIGNAGTDFIAGGGLTLAGAFTTNSTAAFNAAVTLGDNAADTVTSTAGVWTFSNATTVDLADSSRGALVFEGGLLALDTLNSRIGIGTTTPTTTLDVVGTGKFSGLLTASSGLSINSETVTDFSGSGIVVTGNALTVNLTTSGTTGSTSSNSGLDVGSAGLTLLKGCADGEILEYTDAGGWACAVDSDTGNVSGFTDFGSIVALTTTADNLGVGTSSPTNKLSVLGTADISGNLGVGTTTPAFKLDVVGSTNLSSGSTYKINGTDVLSGSGLGVGVTASSLTSLGTLGNVTVAGISALNGGITFDQSSDTISSFTLSGTQFAGNNLIVNIGDTGTDFIAGGGLTLAGAFTANSTSALNGAVTLGDASDDTVTSNAGVWSYANSTTIDLVNSSRNALNIEGGLLSLDTLNSRVGIGSSSSLAGLDVQTTAWLRGAAGGASGLYVNGSGNVGIGITMPQNKLDVSGSVAFGSLPTNPLPQANSAYFSGNVGIGTTNPQANLNVANNSLSTGTGLLVSSTSTSFSSGKLASIDWSPSSATTATGDVLSVNVGANGVVGNIFNVMDGGTSVFSVSQSVITAGLPVNFTAPGDVGIAYDLLFSNQTASNIKSYGPLTIESGESFESNYLTLKTYNSGQIVFDAPGGILLAQAQPWTLATSAQALNIQNGLLNLDTTNSRVGIGTSNPLAGFDVHNTAWLRGAASGASGLYVNGSGNVGIGVTAPKNKLDVSGSVAFGSLPTNPLPQSNSAYFSGNVGIGTTNPLFGLEINGTARVNGAVTFGDAVGDTVTSTAGSWTFSNASTFDLANSQLNSLNFESGLLNIDTSGSTVGIGTTVPTAKLSVLQTGSANSFLVQDVASDTSPFVIDASGRVGIGTTTPSDSISLEVVGDTRLGGNISRNAHGSNNLNDQGSISPNGGFEGLTVSTANLPDDWVDVDTGSAVSSTQVAQGDRSLRMSTANDEVMSTCYPATGGNTLNFNMSSYLTSSDATRLRMREYTTLANCTSNTSPTTTDTTQCTGAGVGQAWTTCSAAQVLASGTRWMRTGIYFLTKSSTHVYIDSVRVTQNALTNGLDLAETYPAAKADGIKVGEIVSFGTANKQVGADVNNVTRSAKAYDNLAFGIVSTKPGVVLDDQGANEKIQVALKGRVPVLVSTENGPIKIGDPIVASSKPGVGMKATKAGKILGYAMTEFVNTDPTVIDQVIVFVESSWFDPSLALGSTGDVNGVISSLASLSPSNTDDIAKDLVKISSDFEKLTLSMNALDSKVDGVEGEVTKLSSENASLTARLSGLEDKLKQLEEGGAVLGIGSTNPQLSGESIASASAALDDADSLIDGTESKLSEITVTGLAKLNNLNVIGDATFGMMQIVGIDPAGGSNIDTITGPLRLQATALNDLDIMNGKVLVTTDGNIITKGQITAKKLNISTQDDAEDNSVGVAKLLKGTKKVVVKTTAITEKSHVFVTPKTLLDYPLVVTVLEPQTSFTVEVKSSEDKDVEFDWFIVN